MGTTTEWRNRIHQGHTLDVLRGLPDESVQAVITSPPYWGLRLYATQPQVWGGRPGCAHDWKIRTVRDTRGTQGGTINNHQTMEASRFDLEWATCTDCGAFRAEMGLEPLHDCLAWARRESPCAVCYVCHIRTVFSEVRRVLRKDGVLFLNLGDSYTSGGRASRDAGKSHLHAATHGMGRPETPPGLKPKDLVGVPWRCALALQGDGWYLRNDDIWAKENAMPSSVQDRCTVSHEYIFMLSKSERYFFDAFAIREQSVETAAGNKDRRVADGGRGRPANHMGSSIPWTGTGRNKRTVWRMSTDQFSEELCKACGRIYGLSDYKQLAQNGKGRVCRCGSSDGWVSHFAIFPEKLVATCLLAGTSEKGACADCGAPWERMVERPKLVPKDYEGKWRLEDKNASGRRMQANCRGAREAGFPHDNPFPDPVSVGWRPTCRCHGKIVEEEVDAGDGETETARVYEPSIPLDEHPVSRCVVMDVFMGSGTTALVALKSGRDFVGTELNPDYIRLAEHRIAKEISQPKLF